MVDFAKLKKNSQDSLAKLSASIQKLDQTQNYGKNEEEYWSPVVDKAGNGSAIIRFLPNKDEDALPFVRYWDHGFKGPNGWYIEKSLTTLGLPDPVDLAA